MGLFDFIKYKKRLNPIWVEENLVKRIKKLNNKATYQVILGDKGNPATKKDIDNFVKAYDGLVIKKPNCVFVTSHVVKFKKINRRNKNGI